jgi:hypothetical protein
MSKYISEIVNDIRKNPTSWKRLGPRGLYKDNIYIDGCGNGHILLFAWATSIVDVTINGKLIPDHLTLFDKIRLEQTFKWWMKNASLEMMKAE